MISCGNDIIRISRVKESIDDIGETFLKRVYTDEEINYCESRRMCKFHSYAARFAAKEAVAKMFGTGFNGRFDWTDIEIRNEKTGKPEILLYQGALDLFNEKGYKEISVSISHSKEYATSMVIGC